MTDGDSFEMGYIAASATFLQSLPGRWQVPALSQDTTFPLPEALAASVPVLMNSFTGTQLYPCVYILLCSCFGIRTGWEDWDKCHGTDIYGICHLSPFRENCLSAWLALSFSLQTCILPGYSMGTWESPTNTFYVWQGWQFSCTVKTSIDRISFQHWAKLLFFTNILLTILNFIVQGCGHLGTLKLSLPLDLLN